MIGKIIGKEMEREGGVIIKIFTQDNDHERFNITENIIIAHEESEEINK